MGRGGRYGVLGKQGSATMKGKPQVSKKKKREQWKRKERQAGSLGGGPGPNHSAGETRGIAC